MKQIPKVSILNRPGKIFFEGCLKFYFKSFIRRMLSINRGPDVVLKSLFRGLSGLKIPFNFNPTSKQLADTVHVLSNPAALKWAIKQKTLGKIKTLVAGPNICILPSDFDNLLCSKAIDIILLPSEWTKEAYTLEKPELKNKIKVWPAGVAILPLPERIPVKKILLFKKEFDEKSYLKIKEILQSKKILHVEIDYGSFSQADYFQSLSKVCGMIYLQKAESQGLALQEAWARNIPTLVWNSGTYTYPNTNITVRGPVGAPYLTDQSGLFFDSINEFPEKLQDFIDKIDTFTPRDYCIKYLSDEASSLLYSEILNLK